MATTGIALPVGSPAPDTDLMSDQEKKVTLSTLWQAKPLVLVFLLDAKSPNCAERAIQLRDAQQQIEQAGGALAAVTNGGPLDAGNLRSQYSLEYPLLCDPGQTAYTLFGISSETSASFVIDTQGVVRYGHVEPDILSVPPTWTLVEAVSTITGAAFQRPEPPSFERPQPVAAFATPGVRLASNLNFTCVKCGGSDYEVNAMSTAGGWLSRLFNFQYRKFSAVSCKNCKYTELYRAESGALANIFDILAGG